MRAEHEDSSETAEVAHRQKTWRQGTHRTGWKSRARHRVHSIDPTVTLRAEEVKPRGHLGVSGSEAGSAALLRAEGEKPIGHLGAPGCEGAPNVTVGEVEEKPMGHLGAPSCGSVSVLEGAPAMLPSCLEDVCPKGHLDSFFPEATPSGAASTGAPDVGFVSVLPASSLFSCLFPRVAPDTGHTVAASPAFPAASAAPSGSAPTRAASPVSSALAARKGHLDMTTCCFPLLLLLRVVSVCGFCLWLVRCVDACDWW